MIGEDFSYYRKLAPICLVWLGTRENDNKVIDLHSPKFSIDEKSLFNASLVLLDIIKGTDL
jgi:metal-dependent amidase/aminoacylase/carboxypeptidase family protein